MDEMKEARATAVEDAKKHQSVLRPKKRQKLTRAEKTEQIRAALFDGAAKVVGEHGYLNAMIQMITNRANVANGTFYNYFETRQDLFDKLLPDLGRKMLTYIGDRSSEGEDEIERERKRLLAFFEFLQEHNEFYRILYEAEVFAPTAFEEHTSLVKKRYMAVLQRALQVGEITGYTSRELEVIVMILMGARHYMAMNYGPQDGRSGELPSWVIDAYVKFIAGGFKALAESQGSEKPPAPKSRRRGRATT